MTMDAASSNLRPWIGLRLLALLYDALAMLGVWFAVGAVSLLLHGGEPVRSGSAAGWLELLALVVATGFYATLSWRLGGQTLGMRAWRLRVIDARAPTATPGWAALWRRFAVGAMSLAAAGAGFWWALWDRNRLTWHDRASGTRVVRLPKSTA